MKLALAALMVVGIQTVSLAETAQAAYSSSWAGGTCTAPQMVVGVQDCKMGTSSSGSFNVVTATYNVHGQCSSSCFTYDSSGSHATVLANVMFNGKAAIATLVMSVHPNGTSSEGVEIKDATTKAVLATTGRNAQGNIIELTVVKGSIFISPASVTAN